jgi:putative acetyltransferase
MSRAADHSTIPRLDRGISSRKGQTDISISISVETPPQDDVRALVTALNTYLIPLTPREFQFQLTAEQMAEPTVTVLVARDAGGRPVGMGALKDHGGGVGEVKRMFTRPEARGKRIGARLLERIEALARQRGIKRLVLETGEAPGFEPAWRVYERGGYTRCAPVLDYPDSGHNRFYEKQLA